MQLKFTRLRRLRGPALLLAACLLVTGCTEVSAELKRDSALACPSGSDCYDPPKPAGPGGQLTVRATEFDFTFQQDNPSVQEGPVEVTLNNAGEAEHNFTIDEALGNQSVPSGTQDLAGGETASTTLELFAGTYTFYCSVPGHREAGMEGSLEVVDS